MKLRAKLLLTQAPILLALILILVIAIKTVRSLGNEPGLILSDNLRSLDAAHEMARALDILDLEVTTAALRQVKPTALTMEKAIKSFQRELALQKSNVTEAGESEATERLKQAWENYLAGVSAGIEANTIPLHQQRSQKLRAALDEILRLNRRAVNHKAELAKQEAARLSATLAIAAISALIIALGISGFLLRKILMPIKIMEQSVRRISEGDFTTRLLLDGQDEIASLANAFNQMAARLHEYRASSLGELLQLNNRLQSVMDSLVDAVIVYNLDGHPLLFNEVARDLFGEAQELQIDRLPAALQEQVEKTFRQVRREGEAHELVSMDSAIEVPLATSSRWFLVAGTPVQGTTSTMDGVTIVLRDVTRLRLIEGFRGDLVATAAHELRTPLTSLHMAVHLCLELAAGPLTEHQIDLLTAARQDCERLQNVVEELLEMARLESGSIQLQMVACIVADLLEEVITRRRNDLRREGRVLQMERGDLLLTVKADPERIRNVLDNLIDNALIHTKNNGKIHIGFIQEDANFVRIYVDDDGSGVPLEYRTHVFNKFFRVPGTHRVGTGLGLSIVHDIVRAHGGRVGVSDSPFGGARFWFTLPLQLDATSC